MFSRQHILEIVAVAALASQVGAGEVPFTKFVVSPSADGAVSVHAADMDGDGNLDLLSASQGDSTVAWYRNDGGSPPGFMECVVSNNALNAASVYAAYVNDDDRIDVLSASQGDDKIAWYENTGTFDGLCLEFVEHEISTNADVAVSVFAAHLDDDEYIDVLSASAFDNKIAWYQNSGPPDFEFTEEIIISNTAVLAECVYAADLDGDGDIDVLSASEGDDTVAWYENNGGSPQPTFFRHTPPIWHAADGAISVYAIDLDDDGDVDVLSAWIFADTIAWHENLGGSPLVFSDPHIISDNALGATSVFAEDVNGDGLMDVLSSSQNDDKITWYENLGSKDGEPPVFVECAVPLSDTEDEAFSVYAADVDGDGDIDVVSAANLSDRVAWYQNDGPLCPGDVNDDGAVDPLDSGFVLARFGCEYPADGENCLAADANSDGNVDPLDSGFVLARFGECP